MRHFGVWRAISFSVCLFSGLCFAQTWTAATGTATIGGKEQGPIYPCGSGSCPTYDSGQIKITVNGFSATASYSNQSGKKTTSALASSLAGLLNQHSSPVIAAANGSKITLTSKTTGANTDWPLSAKVTYNTHFSRASFTVTLSSSTLKGGTGVMPAPISSLSAEVSNNTSACSSSSDLLGNLLYCGILFEGSSANLLDSAAQTLVPDSPAGHVSNVSLHELMYSGWNGKMICEYQPWFGNPSHKDIGYNENDPRTIIAQDSAMIAAGCDINLIDYYGALSADQSFDLATTNLIAADVNSRTGTPLKFGLMEDKGALTSSCPTNGAGIDQTNCLQTALIKEMDFINQNYANLNSYWTDNGQPVIVSFVTQSLWTNPAPNWTTIWSNVKAHTDIYSKPFKYIFQYGSFSSEPYDNGRFGWIQVTAFDAAKQFWWGSNTSASPTYLDSLYNAGKTHTSQLTIGALYKGFDDNYAAWGGNRVMAQQCGQVLLNTAQEVNKYFGGTNPQIPYMQVVTWNDYEEGTEVESGIDNCYNVNASLSGNVLSWSLLSSNFYASPATVHHFNVYFADAGGNLYPAATNLPTTTASLNLSTVVPSGTWNIYVEMVGQPLILNRMSNGLTYIH